MDNILIAIILSDATNDKVVYAINSALRQDYDNISLLIAGNLNEKIQLEQVVNAVTSNKKSNLKNVRIKLKESTAPINKYIRYVFQTAQENGIGFVSFLINGDAYYQDNVLTELMEKWDNSVGAVYGNTIVYDENEQYYGELKNVGNIPFYDAIKNLQQNFCVEFQSKQIRIGGLFYVPAFINGFPKRPCNIRYESAIPVLRHSIEKENLSLGYTNYKILLRCQEILSKRHFTNTEINSIYQIIDQIMEGNSTFWGIPKGDLILLSGLTDCLAVNRQRFKASPQKGRFAKVFGRSRIKVVFFAQQYSVWPSLKSVYEKMIEDDRFDTDLVYVPYAHFNSDAERLKSELDHYQEQGYPVIHADHYDLRSAQPDIAFFVIPYSYVPSGFQVEEVRKIVRRCIYIPYGIAWETTHPELIRLRYQLPMQYLAWKVFCSDESELQFAQRYSFTGGENFMDIGNPRLDFIKELPLETDKEYIKAIKERARGRKIVLWNTHHSVNDEDSMFSSWTKFGEKILGYFFENNKIFLLWRPHPLFKKALEKHMGSEKFSNLFKKVFSHDNIMMDEYKDYSASFSASDIFISDQSSLVKEYMLTENPVILTVPDPDRLAIHKTLRECLYIPRTDLELDTFLNQLTGDIDEKRTIRLNYIHRYDMDRDSSIAERIIEYVYSSLNKELDSLKLC